MTRFAFDKTVAIVTGGSRGIGPHIAAALAQRGARIALVARSQPELDAVAGTLREDGGEVLVIAADVTSAADRHRIVETTERVLGPIGLLVNNAGGDPLGMMAASHSTSGMSGRHDLGVWHASRGSRESHGHSEDGSG